MTGFATTEVSLTGGAGTFATVGFATDVVVGVVGAGVFVVAAAAAVAG